MNATGPGPEWPKLPWPDPTPEMLETETFSAIWSCIKEWDIGVPRAYRGHCGATGNHVRAILEALAPLFRQSICIYCQQVFKFDTEEEKNALITHIMTCEKSPMVKLVHEVCGAFDEVVDSITVRVNGDVQCTICQKSYRDHPLYPHVTIDDGAGGRIPYLHKGCDGHLLKL